MRFEEIIHDVNAQPNQMWQTLQIQSLQKSMKILPITSEKPKLKTSTLELINATKKKRDSEVKSKTKALLHFKVCQVLNISIALMSHCSFNMLSVNDIK